MDYINIGSSPCNEDCIQVGDPEYYPKAIQECKRFLDLIREKLGPEPPGARLKVKSFPHDFGTYHEVVCYFLKDNEEAFEYAMRCESDAPQTWNDNQVKPLTPAQS